MIDLIKWIGGLFLLFIIGIYLSIAFYIEFAGNWIIEEEEKLKLIEEINTAKDLPFLFYKVNEQYFPECYNKGFWVSKLKQFFFSKSCISESTIASRVIFIQLRRKKNKSIYNRADAVAIARLVDKNTSLKQCYTYRMRFAEYGENTRNLDEAAETFFNKTIEELNEREVLSLHIISIAPTHFSPRRNPKRLNEKVESLMKMHRKQYYK